jgi:uncharacterized MAPEG superfamily protein
MATPEMHLFMVCAAILVLKMWLTANGTGLLRVTRGVFISPEDYALVGAKPKATDETIERIRRAHQNDLESILPFLAVGFFYAATGPSYSTEWWLFVSFTVGRILHTIFYALGLQPWRTIAFEVGNFALLIMIVLLLARVL